MIIIRMGDSIVPTEFIKTTKDLSDSLKEWIRLDDEIKKLNDQIKVLRGKQYVLYQHNLEFMKANELDFIKLDKGKVSIVDVRTKVSNMTKERLPVKLAEFFEKKQEFSSDDASLLAKEIIDFLNNDSEYKTNTYLRKYTR